MALFGAVRYGARGAACVLGDEISTPPGGRVGADAAGDLALVRNDGTRTHRRGRSRSFPNRAAISSIKITRSTAPCSTCSTARRAPPGSGASSLRRMLYPLVAFPFMKAAGFVVGGFIASALINVAALITLARVPAQTLGRSRRHRGDVAARQLPRRHLLGRASVRERDDRAGVAAACSCCSRGSTSVRTCDGSSATRWPWACSSPPTTSCRTSASPP